MILKSFSYKENNWELLKIAPIDSACLLVGKNATGKSRTIHAIHNVAAFMQMTEIILGSKSFSVNMEFASKSDSELCIRYSFTVKRGEVKEEDLVVNDKAFIKRTSEKCYYQEDEIFPPITKLVTQVRRDRQLYPEIESVMAWAESVVCITCSAINPFTIIGPRLMSNPFPLSELVDNLDESNKRSIYNKAKALGYNLTNIHTVSLSESIKLVRIKEDNVEYEIEDLYLSSGMLRALYLLCFLEYINKKSQKPLLLIDDMSEGLDYQRSTILGQLLLDYCNENKLQMIVSSNDSFLMDVVDISSWQVLRREGSKVYALNQSNSGELFESFRFTGLSNFDLLSSNFIDQFLSSKQRENEKSSVC